MADLLTGEIRSRVGGSRSKRSRLRVIELIGTPGAGKTTVAGDLEDLLRGDGFTPYRPVDAARVFARRTALGRLAALVLAGNQLSRALWAIYLIHSWAHVVSFAFRHTPLMRYVIVSQAKRPGSADVSERRVIYWFLRLSGSLGFLTAKGRPGEVLILDEGFVHRVVQLHASDVEAPSEAAIGRYMGLIPEPDLVIEVSANRELCIERIRARGVWERYRDDDENRLAAFVESARSAVELAIARVDHLKWAHGIVENDGRLDAIRPQLARIVGRHFSWDRPALSPPYPLYTVCVPRPGRVREVIEAAWRPPAVNEDQARQVLSQYGISEVTGVANLPMGWRNRIVRLRTRQGGMVLRSYPDRWTNEAILFEHSLLRRLADVDFPAPRLVTTPSGATLVDAAGSRWALTELMRGSNLSACYIRPAERARLLYVAGATLARFHDALGGFTPDGRHHLGFDAEGKPALDLTWYLATLDELASLRDDPNLGVIPPQRVAEAADRITGLWETIEHAPITTTVIHGDFGLHNLLFDRSGQVGVLDFELARLDWMLIDLARVLSRNQPDTGHAFVSGYRSTSDISPDELHLLPDVWELYRLMGAVRSWSMGRELGDPKRIATSRRRFDEAAWISANGLAPWEVKVQ